MNYEEKKRWLKRYQEALREEAELEDELKQLRADVERITPLLSDAPGGGSNRERIPKGVERIVEVQQRIQEQIVSAQKARAEIVAVIDRVRPARGREILRRRYLLGQRWEEIAYVMHIDFSWLMRLHKRIVVGLDVDPH